MRQREIELNVPDGTKMKAFVGEPAQAKSPPAMMAFQEAFGLKPHIKDVATRLAEEGYLAVAPDLFHRTAPGFQGDYKDFTTAMPHIRALTPEKLGADITT